MDFEIKGQIHHVDDKMIDDLLNQIKATPGEGDTASKLALALADSGVIRLEPLEPVVTDVDFEEGG